MIRISFLLLIIPWWSFGQLNTNVKLLDNWQDDGLVVNSSQVRYNDCWGYAQNGFEYAIAGSTEGTHFFQLSSNNELILLDSVQGKYVSSMVVHRDIKTYKNFAYAVCDEGLSSLQIIDLSYLPDSVHLVVEFDSAFARVHNLFIDSVHAMLYACSVTSQTGGMLQSLKSMQVYSLADPINPQLIYTGPTDIPEVHDAYVRNNIAYLNCGTDGIRVYDFSTPSSPVFLQNMSIYQDQGYNHQGWMTPDGTKYVFGDETGGARLKKCTVDQNNQLQINSLFGTNHLNNSVAHNVMLSNDFAYVAYYNEGLRIFDLRSAIPNEIAHYDTHPEEASFNMLGAWGVYSELPSNRILVSDRNNGLFLFNFNEDIFSQQIGAEPLVFPNPISLGGKMTVLTPNGSNLLSAQLFDMNGKVMDSETVENQTYLEFNVQVRKGLYYLLISYVNSSGEFEAHAQKIIVH